VHPLAAGCEGQEDKQVTGTLFCLPKEMITLQQSENLGNPEFNSENS
jgi:hypothetical protein